MVSFHAGHNKLPGAAGQGRGAEANPACTRSPFSAQKSFLSVSLVAAGGRHDTGVTFSPSDFTAQGTSVARRCPLGDSGGRFSCTREPAAGNCWLEERLQLFFPSERCLPSRRVTPGRRFQRVSPRCLLSEPRAPGVFVLTALFSTPPSAAPPGGLRSPSSAKPAFNDRWPRREAKLNVQYFPCRYSR